MFGNSDPVTNGEQLFFNHIKNHIKVIFDVGSRYDSEYTAFEGEVHYFDPVSEAIEKLSTLPTKNKVSYYNNFGLGTENKELYYYPKYQSFYDRISSCTESDDLNKIVLNIKKAREYIDKKNIESIDFLKIDTEGYEFEVLKGFEECLQNVKIIQFEYGQAFIDNNVKLSDVINYLDQHGFYKFAYIAYYGLKPIDDFRDHYLYCNIVCVNKNSDYVPY
jgi:FkbM family methyltransferase